MVNLYGPGQRPPQIRPTGAPGPVKPAKTTQPQQGFEAILKQEMGVKFSAHAQKRLESRGIEFGAQEASRLESAVEKAAAKGAKESLVILDDLAMVVSVRNKTVITVVDGPSLKENVFTNIDSAVIG